jgi:hypothetical protein
MGFRLRLGAVRYLHYGALGIRRVRTPRGAGTVRQSRPELGNRKSSEFRPQVGYIADLRRLFDKDNSMSDRKQSKAISSQQLEANRNNAKCSTGPRTQKGKQRAAQNSYKHGFFGTRLFPTQELINRDLADYHRIHAAYWEHYSPVGDLEKLCIEEIAVESLRLARLLGHEQKVLGLVFPFESRSMDKIVRYESNVSRRLDKAIARLERLQEERETQSNQFEPSDFESGEAPKEPDDVSTSINTSEVFQTIKEPHVETSAKQGSVPTVVEPSNKPVEITPSKPPQSLHEVVELAIDPAPVEQPKSGITSDENCGTNPISSNRFVETAEDAEFIERIKRGEDLDLLE